MKRHRNLPLMLGLTSIGVMLLAAVAAAYEGGAQDCDPGNPDPSICGQNSGFVPFHKDAIHASLTWANESSVCPKMLIYMRPSEYTPSDYLLPTDPSVDPPTFPGFDPAYVQRVQGGFELGQLDESGWSRYAPDRDRENAQLIDVCGLQEQIDQGIFTIKSFEEEGLDDDYMALTDPFFEDAGNTKGLAYNLFCSGHVSGVDGRIYVSGGHDKGGNNGTRKNNIFDPAIEEWVPRTVPCVKSQFEADPTGGVRHCLVSPDGTIDTDPLNEDNTDPADPSDMEHQRWYPTSVTLPNGKILRLSGSDQDTSVGPMNASATKVRVDVPEVYDPHTDTNVSLNNARKLFNMYPRAFVAQRGHAKDDWKVCVAGGAVVPPLPGPPAPGPLQPGQCPITEYDPWQYGGDIYCLDVQAALADPNRDVDGHNHWEHIGTLASAHNFGAAVRLVKIQSECTWSDKVYLFGGTNGCNSDAVATAEMIDFSASPPTWQTIDPLVAAVEENNAAVLPDGNILVVGGRGGGVDNLRYQMYDQAGNRRLLLESPVPRHDHSTLLVVPEGSAWVMGGNRVNLTDPPGPQTQEQRDLAVPVLEEYKPPYFFKGLARPAIVKNPSQIHHKQKFKVDFSGGAIGSVVLLRTGPVTHNWSWGNQYVSLPFAKEANGELQVTAPPLPGLAIAGDYLLFIVSTNGVPSEGKHIRLENTPN
jgi:hypothetical protein